MICPTPYPTFKQWEHYSHSTAQKLADNKHRLHLANSLTRDLQIFGIRVQYIDIAVPRPRLYLDQQPTSALPIRGITRRRIDSEVFECAAILNDCELVWTEFEDEVAA